MSCCSSNNCDCTCDSCVQQSAFNSPLTEVNKGTRLLVEDRNGNPKKLKKKDFAIPASIAGGAIEMHDGSIQDPINLKLLQELQNSNCVLVRNGQGTIGVAVPVEEDTFLAYVGGTVQFVKTIPKTTLFSNQEISAQSGRLAIIGCSSGGFSELGFFTDTGDYLSASEGQVSAKNFCDAESVTELDYLFGCQDGLLKKIAPSEGLIIAEDAGKWVLKEVATDEVWVGGSDIWSKTYTSTGDMTFSDTTVAFGSGVPNTAKWVQIRVTNFCATSTTYGEGTVYINNIPVIRTKTIGSFNCHQGSTSLYVPYGSGSFTIRGQLVVTTAGSTNAGGQLATGILSYR